MPFALRMLLAAILGGWLLAPTAAFADRVVGTTATYYHPSFQGLVMANGAAYNRWDPGIAACNWFPLGTLLRITHQQTGDHVYVRVMDRGSSRLTVDLSEAGFSRLSSLGHGRIPVWIEVVQALDGEDESLALDLSKPSLLSGPGEGPPADPPVTPHEAPPIASPLVPTAESLAAVVASSSTRLPVLTADERVTVAAAQLATPAPGWRALRPLAI